MENDLSSESSAYIENIRIPDEINDSNYEENLFFGEILEVHLDNYHMFPGNFIDYVGKDNFNKWIEQNDKINFDKNGYPILEDGCSIPKCNIYEFIKYFNVSEEEFYDLWYYSWSYYLYDYNIDILYNGDKEQIEEYYRRDYNEYSQMMAVRESEYNFILDLKSLYFDDLLYGKDFREVFNLGYNRFSIPQLIYEADLPRESVEKVYERIRTKPYSDSCYDYDFEAIYTQKETIMEAMKTKTPEEINNIVKSVDGVPCSDVSVQDLAREFAESKER
jgi:hypothetical protein